MDLTERIESVILSNLQPKEERKIGIECECILYNKNLQRIPVNPSDEISTSDIKKELEVLQKDDRKKAGLTLEPGGQIEWASPPLNNLHELNEQFQIHKKRLSKIARREQLKTIDYSLEPIYDPKDIPLIDNKKYRLMNKMFMKTGRLGPWMMRNTASVQINIDFTSKNEAEQMAYIADCITPISSVLFANSPFWGGEPAGKANLRYRIWNDTDKTRCGYLLNHGISSSTDLIKKYSEYIQTVPAIFILDKFGDVIEFDNTLGEWLSNLEGAGHLTDDLIQVALHQIFTHVRFKNVIEIRGSDKPPSGFELVPAAFWIGLLFDDDAQNEIYSIVKKWKITDRKNLINIANALDLEKKGPDEYTVNEWIKIISGISLGGLKNRSEKINTNSEVLIFEKYMDLINTKGIPALYTQKMKLKNGKTIKDFIK